MPDPDAIEIIALRGRSALAWEVLRRDPAYSAAWMRMSSGSSTDGDTAAAFAADWGLHFP